MSPALGSPVGDGGENANLSASIHSFIHSSSIIIIIIIIRDSGWNGMERNGIGTLGLGKEK